MLLLLADACSAVAHADEAARRAHSEELAEVGDIGRCRGDVGRCRGDIGEM